MRKELLIPGKVYQNKTGNSVRELLKIGQSHEVGAPGYLRDRLCTKYKQLKGPAAGQISYCEFNSFQTWARSEYKEKQPYEWHCMGNGHNFSTISEHGLAPISCPFCQSEEIRPTEASDFQ